MKKILLVGLLLISTVAFSQVEKGDISATANFAFSSMKYKDADEATNMTLLNLRGGYFFTDNVEAGLNLNVVGMSFDGDPLTTVGIGPYAVYNFLTSDGKILPYIGANYLSQKTTDMDAVGQIGAFGGMKYFLTEVVNIDTSLNYTSFLGDLKGSMLVLNVGIGINFGKLN